MNDLGYVQEVTTRKDHRCEICYGPIPKGETCAYMHGRYDGEWQNWHAHTECNDDFQSDGDEEFIPGSAEMPDRVRELLEKGKR